MPPGVEWFLSSRVAPLQAAHPGGGGEALGQEARPVARRGEALSGGGRPWRRALPAHQRGKRRAEIGMNGVGFPPGPREMEIGFRPGRGVKGVRQTSSGRRVRRTRHSRIGRRRAAGGNGAGRTSRHAGLHSLPRCGPQRTTPPARPRLCLARVARTIDCRARRVCIEAFIHETSAERANRIMAVRKAGATSARAAPPSGAAPARAAQHPRGVVRTPIALTAAGIVLGWAAGAGLALTAAGAALAAPPVWLGAGAGVGGVIGAVLAWWTHPLRPRLQDSADLARLGATIVSLPFATPEELRRLAPDRRSPVGLLIERPGSPFAAGVRDVLSALDTAATQDPSGRIVLVAGAHGGVGATTLAAALATAAAADGRRVLLIDADLRARGATHALALDGATAGIHEAAMGAAPLDHAIIPDGGHGFDVAPASASRLGGGRELYSAALWADILTQLRIRYDLVIMDAPAALEAVETRMLARSVDAVVLAGRRAKTQRFAAAAAHAALRKGAPVAVAVLTDAPPPKPQRRPRR